MWGPSAADPEKTCRPFEIEIYDVAAELLRGWKPSAVVDYRGEHGLAYPERPRAGRRKA